MLSNMYFHANIKTGIFLLLVIFYLNTGAQDFKKHILFLASDSLHGRAPGTLDETHAANYIAAQLGTAKCRIVLQPFAFHDSSQSIPRSYILSDSALNVIGFLNFSKDSTIIISAHYDHLGYGSNKSREIVKKGIYPGADDNASGVAMLIELAKWISSNSASKYNFVFAAFSAHEAGLYGSGYFSQSKLCTALKIRAVINFDMLGRLDTTSKTIKVSITDTDSTFLRFFHIIDGNMLHFRYDDENIRQSDLAPFVKNNSHVLNLTTGIHQDYHRISDTEEKINYSGMSQIYLMLQKLLAYITF